MGRLRWSLYVAACLCRCGSGDVAQWLRSDGPLVLAKAPDRPDALTVIDALSAEDRVFVLAATTAFNLQTKLKLGDHGAFFACDFGGGAGATVRASVNPGVTRDATSAVLVECRLPEPCYDGDLTRPAGAGDLARAAPVFGANLNAALLIEWVEYHVGLGFDRIHYYDMNFGGGGVGGVLALAGALVVHDWTMAVNPGPLWANPNAATKETVMYAQSLALYDCFLREHTNDRASRGGRPSDWVFYGDVDEVFVAPLVEARKAPDLKALMATAPNATKYLRPQPDADVGAPARPPPGWPVNGDARALTFHFFHNHYVSNPPRKAQMRSGAKVMRGIKFALAAERDILNGFAVSAAAAALKPRPDAHAHLRLRRRRLHGQRARRRNPSSASSSSTAALRERDRAAALAGRGGGCAAPERAA
ncbi:hypothetical protein JL721_3607 [Aureococcus anophagefferens]|nr:hypothetical protein JL721_3607 [Aureococcus anophagefferens]